MTTPRRIVSRMTSSLRHAMGRVHGLSSRAWDWLFDSSPVLARRPGSSVRLRLEQLEDRTCPDAANPNAPILEAIADQYSFENDEIEIAASATDPNQDAITYSAENLPPGLSIDPNTGVISGTIDYTAAELEGGIYNASVTATDTTQLTDTAYFTWNVSNTARTLHWLYTGTGLGDGTDGANWTDNTVPASGDILVFEEGTGDCDLRDFGSEFLVDGMTLAEGYTGTVKLPADFNVGSTGLTMAGGALEIDETLNLLGDCTWSDGAFNSAAAVPAILNQFGNMEILAPSPAVQLPIGKTIEATHIIPDGKITTVTDTRITFKKGAGITVQAGGEFKFAGTANSALVVDGDVGTFEMRGKLTVETPNTALSTYMELHFEQLGVTAETKITTGKLSFRGGDSGGVVARINEGKFIIYGGAQVLNAPSSIMVFVPSSYLTTEQSSQSRATITGDVVINGNLNLDGSGCGQLRIQGNLTFGGTFQATVDFANTTEDRLIVAGDLSLDGTLAIFREGNFQQNMTFTVIKVTGTRVGQFANVDAGGENFTLQYQPFGDVEIKT